jgi:hypothetical protein
MSLNALTSVTLIRNAPPLVSNERNESSTYCFGYKFGFQRKLAVNGSSAYVKPVVVAEIERLDKLNETFSIVHQSNRLAKLIHYDKFDMLTPSMCFSECSLSLVCGAAAFTTDIEFVRNCYLYKKSEVSKNDTLEFDVSSKWILYVKNTVTLLFN